MRRRKISLQGPHGEFMKRVEEWEKDRPKREAKARKEERRLKWKKWLGLANMGEYDSPMPLFLFAAYFFTTFIGGVTLCFLGIFKYSNTLNIGYLLQSAFFAFAGGKLFIGLCPIMKAIIVSYYKEKKERNSQKKSN